MYFSIVLVVLIAVVRVATVKAQLGSIQVPMTIAGSSFSLNFSPEVDSSEAVATKLCVENGASFGITQETLISGCIEPVMKYLDNSIDEWLEEKTLSVPITISDTTFNLRFLPERDSIATMSARVCNENAAVIGVEQDSEDCIGPLTKFLQGSVNGWIDDKTLDTQITLNGKSFDVRFLPERESSTNVAKNLCIQEAARIGGLTNENVMEACIKPVSAFLTTEVGFWIGEKTFKTVVTLNEKKFDVAYMPTRETSAKMAQRLCVEQAEAIGGLTNENVMEACIEPVGKELADRVAAWTLAKTMTLTLTLNEANITVDMTARQSPVVTARNVCISQATAIGGLTDENVVATCIEPVALYLRKALVEWNAAKGAVAA